MTPNTEDAASSERTCLNCGAPVTAQYCPECGQERSDRVIPIWRLVSEFLDNAFAWDSKLLHTLGLLLFSPGLLTEEYARGRHVRYLSPFRVYLYTSAAMFYLLSVQVRSLPAALKSGPAKQAAAEARKAPEVVLTVGGADAKPADSADQYLKDQGGKAPAERDSALERGITVKALKLRKMPATEIARRIATGAVQNAPKAMFILLPVFALLLKLIYLRRGRLYIEHLVFALHCHAFVFALLTAFVAWQIYGPASAAGAVWGQGPIGSTLLTVAGIYLLLAMKRMYQQGWASTILKFVMLAAAYAVLMLITLVGVVAFSLLSA